MYSNFNFMRTELESGWFAIQLEPDDKDDYGKKKLTKVCKSSWSFNLTVNLILKWPVNARVCREKSVVIYHLQKFPKNQGSK